MVIIIFGLLALIAVAVVEAREERARQRGHR
jgi:hypothetical protein